MKKIKQKNGRYIAIQIIIVIIFLFWLFFPEQSLAAISLTPAHKVLEESKNIQNVWTSVKNMVNILVAAVLIYIAFANILRLNISNYAIKKILPTLILAVILTNFSYLICKILIDFSNAIMSLLINGAQGQGATGTGAIAGDTLNQNNIGVAGAFDFTNFDIDPKNLDRSFVLIIAEIVGAIAIFILSFLVFIRNYVIYFLVGLSPLAFMATILPETKKYFSKWWSQYLLWVFLPVVSLFWLWIGGMWYSSGFTGMGSNIVTDRETDFNSALLALAFAGLCYYLAITTPFKMGGEIMNKWGGFGKKAWGATGGKATKWAGEEVKERAHAGYINTKSRFWHSFENSSLGNQNSVLGRARQGVIDYQNRNISAKQERMLRIEAPKMVREHRVEDAKVDAAQRIYRDPRTSTETRGRMRKIMRAWNADEQKSLETSRVSDIVQEINNPVNPNNTRGFLDARGNIVTQDDIANRPYTNSGGFGRLWALVEKLKKIYRTDRDPQARADAYYALTGNPMPLGSGNVRQPTPGMNPLRLGNLLNHFNANSGRPPVADVFQIESSGYWTSAVQKDQFAQEVAAEATSQAQTSGSSDGASGASAQNGTTARTSTTVTTPNPKVEASAKDTTEQVFTEEHKHVAEALRNPSQSGAILHIDTATIHSAASNANLNLSEEGAVKLANLATQAIMDTKGQVTEKYNERYQQVTDDAILNNGIMDRLSKSNKAKDTVEELLRIAEEGKVKLAEGDMVNAVAAAQLIDPRNSIHLRNMDKDGDTERLRRNVEGILNGAETQLTEMSKKSGVVLAEDITNYRKGGEKAWREQYIDREMQGVAQDSHREVIIQERLQSLPLDTPSIDELKQVLQDGFYDLLASHRDLSESLGQLPEGKKDEEISKVRNEMNKTIETTLRNAMPSIQDAGQMDVAKQKEVLSMVLNNPRFITNLAKGFGKAMDGSLQKTNEILQKKGPGPHNDISHPPANAGNPSPPPAFAAPPTTQAPPNQPSPPPRPSTPPPPFNPPKE